MTEQGAEREQEEAVVEAAADAAPAEDAAAESATEDSVAESATEEAADAAVSTPTGSEDAAAPTPDEIEAFFADDLLPVLEAILFASHEPMTARRISHALPGIETRRVAAALEVLADALEERRSPLQLVELAGGFRLVTRPEYAPYLARLFNKAEKERLSPAALETLAIIAYRQPVTRADIEGIRGVQAGPVLRALQERKLIKVVGRAPVVGRPQQYGTTRRFLDHFGLASLDQLPVLFGDEQLPGGVAPIVPDLDVDPDELEDPLEQIDQPADEDPGESPHGALAELEAMDAAEAAEEDPSGPALDEEAAEDPDDDERGFDGEVDFEVDDGDDGEDEFEGDFEDPEPPEDDDPDRGPGASRAEAG